MSKADELRRAYVQAKERFAKIGQAEPHFSPAGRGALSSVKVMTTICHQASPSAKNYWEDEAFDFALADVIKADFTALAMKAFARMEKAANDALVSEEQALRDRLAEIESIKAQEAA